MACVIFRLFKKFSVVPEGGGCGIVSTNDYSGKAPLTKGLQYEQFRQAHNGDESTPRCQCIDAGLNTNDASTKPKLVPSYKCIELVDRSEKKCTSSGLDRKSIKEKSSNDSCTIRVTSTTCINKNNKRSLSALFYNILPNDLDSEVLEDVGKDVIRTEAKLSITISDDRLLPNVSEKENFCYKTFNGKLKWILPYCETKRSKSNYTPYELVEIKSVTDINNVRNNKCKELYLFPFSRKKKPIEHSEILGTAGGFQNTSSTMRAHCLNSVISTVRFFSTSQPRVFSQRQDKGECVEKISPFRKPKRLVSEDGKEYPPLWKNEESENFTVKSDSTENEYVNSSNIPSEVDKVHELNVTDITKIQSILPQLSQGTEELTIKGELRSNEDNFGAEYIRSESQLDDSSRNLHFLRDETINVPVESEQMSYEEDSYSATELKDTKEGIWDPVKWKSVANDDVSQLSENYLEDVQAQEISKAPLSTETDTQVPSMPLFSALDEQKDSKNFQDEETLSTTFPKEHLENYPDINPQIQAKNENINPDETAGIRYLTPDFNFFGYLSKLYAGREKFFRNDPFTRRPQIDSGKEILQTDNNVISEEGPGYKPEENEQFRVEEEVPVNERREEIFIKKYNFESVPKDSTENNAATFLDDLERDVTQPVRASVRTSSAENDNYQENLPKLLDIYALPIKAEDIEKSNTHMYPNQDIPDVTAKKVPGSQITNSRSSEKFRIHPSYEGPVLDSLVIHPIKSRESKRRNRSICGKAFASSSASSGECGCPHKAPAGKGGSDSDGCGSKKHNCDSVCPEPEETSSKECECPENKGTLKELIKPCPNEEELSQTEKCNTDDRFSDLKDKVKECESLSAPEGDTANMGDPSKMPPCKLTPRQGQKKGSSDPADLICWKKKDADKGKASTDGSKSKCDQVRNIEQTCKKVQDDVCQKGRDKGKQQDGKEKPTFCLSENGSEKKAITAECKQTKQQDVCKKDIKDKCSDVKKKKSKEDVCKSHKKEAGGSKKSSEKCKKTKTKQQDDTCKSKQKDIKEKCSDVTKKKSTEDVCQSQKKEAGGSKKSSEKCKETQTKLQDDTCKSEQKDTKEKCSDMAKMKSKEDVCKSQKKEAGSSKKSSEKCKETQTKPKDESCKSKQKEASECQKSSEKEKEKTCKSMKKQVSECEKSLEKENKSKQQDTCKSDNKGSKGKDDGKGTNICQLVNQYRPKQGADSLKQKEQDCMPKEKECKPMPDSKNECQTQLSNQKELCDKEGGSKQITQNQRESCDKVSVTGPENQKCSEIENEACKIDQKRQSDCKDVCEMAKQLSKEKSSECKQSKSDPCKDSSKSNAQCEQPKRDSCKELSNKSNTECEQPKSDHSKEMRSKSNTECEDLKSIPCKKLCSKSSKKKKECSSKGSSRNRQLDPDNSGKKVLAAKSGNQCGSPNMKEKRLKKSKKASSKSDPCCSSDKKELKTDKKCVKKAPSALKQEVCKKTGAADSKQSCGKQRKSQQSVKCEKSHGGGDCQKREPCPHEMPRKQDCLKKPEKICSKSSSSKKSDTCTERDSSRVKRQSSRTEMVCQPPKGQQCDKVRKQKSAPSEEVCEDREQSKASTCSARSSYSDAPVCTPSVMNSAFILREIKETKSECPPPKPVCQPQKQVCPDSMSSSFKSCEGSKIPKSCVKKPSPCPRTMNEEPSWRKASSQQVCQKQKQAKVCPKKKSSGSLIGNLVSFTVRAAIFAGIALFLHVQGVWGGTEETCKIVETINEKLETQFGKGCNKQLDNTESSLKMPYFTRFRQQMQEQWLTCMRFLCINLLRTVSFFENTLGLPEDGDIDS